MTQGRKTNGPDIHVGVIGCGYWGSKHVRVLSSISGVSVSLIDRDQGRREALEAEYPISRSVSELDDVLGELDAVVIATPPSGHHPLAKACLEAGVHALVEKPLTTNVADANELIRLADDAGLVLMVGHTFEFNPAVWALAETVRSPEFGRVRYVDSARLNLGLYQPDVDVLWDLAPHDISILNHVLGSRPTSVNAWPMHLMAEKADVAYLALRYDDIDVGACIHVSWLDPMKVRRTTVIGENAMAVYDDVNAEERLRVYDKGVAPLEHPANGSAVPLTYRNGDIISPFIDFKEPLQLELGHFVECIRTGSIPTVDGRSGLEVVSVLCAAEEAIASGGWVTVDYGDDAVIDLRTDRSLDQAAGQLVHIDVNPDGQADVLGDLGKAISAAGFVSSTIAANTSTFERPDGAVISIHVDGSHIAELPSMAGPRRSATAELSNGLGADAPAYIAELLREHGYRTPVDGAEGTELLIAADDRPTVRLTTVPSRTASRKEATRGA